MTSEQWRKAKAIRARGESLYHYTSADVVFDHALKLEAKLKKARQENKELARLDRHHGPISGPI